MLGAAAADRGDGVVEGEGGVHRVAGDVRDRCREQATVRPGRRAGHGQPAERALVDEAQFGPPSVEDEPDPQVRSSGRPAGGDEHLAAHAQVREHRVVRPSPSPSQRYFPRRRTAVIVRPARRAAKSSPPARWRRTARGCSHLDARDPAADDVAGQASPDDLDLGQLRHRRLVDPGLAPLPDAGLGRQGPPGELGGPLLGLLLGAPVPEPQRPAADHRRAVNELGVVGAVSSAIRYSGTPRSAGRRQLLQAGLPVQPGAEQRRRLAISESNSRCTTVPRDLQAVLAGTPRRSPPRARRRGCCPCPGRRWSPRRGPATGAPEPSGPSRRPTSASALQLTTLARSLASRPSGRSGWSR